MSLSSRSSAHKAEEEQEGEPQHEQLRPWNGHSKINTKGKGKASTQGEGQGQGKQGHNSAAIRVTLDYDCDRRRSNVYVDF